MRVSRGILQTEIPTIERCLKMILDTAIHSDSQAFIKAPNSPVIHSKLICQCRSKLNEVGKENKVSLIWVPGHSGNENILIMKDQTTLATLVPFYVYVKTPSRRSF